jgi:hypothetical protein
VKRRAGPAFFHAFAAGALRVHHQTRAASRTARVIEWAWAEHILPDQPEVVQNPRHRRRIDQAMLVLPVALELAHDRVR